MSKFTLFSIGYVAVDKEPDSPYARIIPIETTPQLDGILEDGNITIQFEGIDEEGDPIVGELNSSNAIVPKWIGSDSQRMTPPNLVKGEVVNIYKYGDTDRYYWAARNIKAHLRDQEHVVFLVAAKKDNDRAYLTLENAYSFVLSSRNKVIQLRMTTDNGEVAGYTTLFDGANGIGTIRDTCGQEITIESLKNRITLGNKQGTRLHLDKENFLITHKGDYHEETGGDTSVVCSNFSVECGDFKVDCDNFKVKASKVLIDCPKSTITGMVQTGPLTCASLSIAPAAAAAASTRSLAAPASSGPICSIQGDMSLQGDLKFVGGSLDMGGGNITGVGALSGKTASFSGACTAPNIK